MKMERKFQPELVASKDVTRGTINYVHVETDDLGKSVAVATDGKRLVVVPVELEEKEKKRCWFFTRKQLAAIRKAVNPASKSTLCAKLHSKAIEYGNLIERVTEKVYGNYPNWQQVFPDRAKHPIKMKIRLNAAYLAELQQAMGASGVVIEIEDDIAPLVVRPIRGDSGAYGILMPIIDASEWVDERRKPDARGAQPPGGGQAPERDQGGKG